MIFPLQRNLETRLVNYTINKEKAILKNGFLSLKHFLLA